MNLNQKQAADMVSDTASEARSKNVSSDNAKRQIVPALQQQNNNSTVST